MSDRLPYNEETVLSLLSKDSQYAFQLIYDRHKDGIYRVAVSMLKSTVLAQEVVQDVFMKVWFERQKLHELRSFEDWLFIVARNQIFNQLKKVSIEWKNAKGLHEQGTYESILDDADANLDRNAYSQLHQKAMESLTNHQKDVYQLVKLKSFSYREVALILNISPLTVKKHMSRALHSIRKYIHQAGFRII